MKYSKIEAVSRIDMLFHYAVRAALEKERWVITDDPLKVGAGGAKFEIDLGAEGIVAADRGEERIAIEIKTFAGDSPITDYHAALGQFLNYRLALELNNIDRTLYLAIPILIYEAFFQKEFLRISVERYQIKLIVYYPVREVVERWIN